MRKPKKFKRYDEGGAVGAGSGDPFSYTDFSNRERNLRKPSEAAPVEEAKPSSVRKPAITESKLPDAETPAPAKEPARAEKEPVKNRGETDFNYEPQKPYNQALEDAKEQGRRARDAFKPANKPAAGKPINISTGASGFPTASSSSAKPSYVGAGDSDDSTETKKKNELERLKRVGSGAVEQTMEGPLEAGLFGLMGGIPSKARMAYGAAKKAYNEFTKPAAKPAEKSEPKLDSKAEPKQGQLFDEAGQPTPAALGKPAPKEAPKAEPKAETKSGAIQPTGKGPSEAGRKLMQEAGRGKPQTMREKAIEEVNASRAATKDPRGPVSDTKGAIKPTYKGPSQAGKEKMENAGKDSRGPLMEGSRPARPESKPIKPTGEGPSEAGKKLMERTNNRSSTILEHERKPDLAMQEYISGRESARTRARDLPDDGLSTTRYANKKGGKIPAFKKGGFVGRGDGCAQRGKTKGRMV